MSEVEALTRLSVYSRFAHALESASDVGHWISDGRRIGRDRPATQNEC